MRRARRILEAALCLCLATIGHDAQAQDPRRQPTLLQPDERISLKFPREVSVFDLYSALGKALGVNMIFEPGLVRARLAVVLDDVDPPRALDVMMQRGRHFYSVIDDRSIFLVSDTPQNRRAFDNQALIAFVLENIETADAMARLRAERSDTALAAPRPDLLLARGTLRELRAVERFLRRADRPPAGSGNRRHPTAASPPELVAPGSIPRLPAARFAENPAGSASTSAGTMPVLAPRSLEPIDVIFSEPLSVLDIYRALGSAFGVNVLFDSRLRAKELAITLSRVDAAKGFSILHRIAGHFSIPLDEHSLLIAEDTPQNHRLYEPETLRTFAFDHAPPRAILPALRDVLGVRNVALLDDRRFAIRDSAEMGEIIAWLVDLLDRAGSEVSLEIEILERDGVSESENISCLAAEEMAGLRARGAVRSLWRRSGLHVTGDRRIGVSLASERPLAAIDSGLEIQIQARVHPRSRDVTLAVESRIRDDPERFEPKASSSLRFREGETCLIAGIVPAETGGPKRLLALTPRIFRLADPDEIEREMLWVGSPSFVSLGTGPRLEPLIPGPFVSGRPAATDTSAAPGSLTTPGWSTDSGPFSDPEEARDRVRERLRERLRSLPRGLESAGQPPAGELPAATAPGSSTTSGPSQASAPLRAPEVYDPELRERPRARPQSPESKEQPAADEPPPATTNSRSPSTLPPPPPRPVPRPPPIDLEFLGVFGAPTRLIALLKGGGLMVLASEGDVVKKRYIVHRIAPGSVSFKFVGFPDAEARVLNLSGER
ncbi:MAG: hypothetical protein GY856_25695 [bacterium]|nr:hypothetical protein [bacterium]